MRRLSLAERVRRARGHQGKAPEVPTRTTPPSKRALPSWREPSVPWRRPGPSHRSPLLLSQDSSGLPVGLKYAETCPHPGLPLHLGSCPSRPTLHSMPPLGEVFQSPQHASPPQGEVSLYHCEPWPLSSLFFTCYPVNAASSTSLQALQRLGLCPPLIRRTFPGAVTVPAR